MATSRINDVADMTFLLPMDAIRGPSREIINMSNNSRMVEIKLKIVSCF